MFVHKVVPKSTENYTFHAANNKVFVNIFRALKVAKNFFNDNKHDSLRSTPKYARIFVLGIICPSGLTVSLSEEIMFIDKYPCIFLRQIVIIVYLMHENVRKTNEREKSIQRNKTLINEIKI